jgi:hypothetical protein
MRDAFEGWDGKGQFAGHETFPLRLLWLKKAYDAVAKGVPVGSFHEPDAIARFGVGRNMAVSMRHWSLASGMVEETGKKLYGSQLGHALLSDEGLDPFLEAPATLWLTHWRFASTPASTTTIYFAFNAVASPDFEVDGLARDIEVLVAEKGWRASRVTIRRDIEVLLRSYVRREDQLNEDAAEPLLAELGLIRSAKSSGRFEFVRGAKPTIPDGIFAYALADFWERHGKNTSLSAEQICYGPGSPGRVFKLDEDSVVTRLMRMEELTRGGWIWTDTAGLKQIQRRRKIDRNVLLRSAYRSDGKTPRRSS